MTKLAATVQGSLHFRTDGRRRQAPDAIAASTVNAEQLDLVVSMARDCLRVQYAALVLTDGEGLSYASRSGFRGTPDLRGLVSAVTDSGCPVMIEDSHLADNAAMSVRVGGAVMRFYSGYPIEAPDGSRIGALCVFGREPRMLRAGDILMKRDLAMLVQRELWVASAPGLAYE